jgi:hypothetical protein
MPEYKKLHQFIKDTRRTLEKIRELYDAPDENVFLTGLKAQKAKLKRAYPAIVRLVSLLREMVSYQNSLVEEIELLEKSKERYYDEIARYQKAKMESFGAAYFSKQEETKVRNEIRRKQEHLVKERQRVDKLQNELIIKQEELQTAIQDTNLAKTSYYHLSDAEIKLFEQEREKILCGVEQFGSISLAVQKDKSITMRVSSIMHYAKKHKQFSEDIEIAKQVFRDSLDAEMVDRALNGTMNPVFQKGEYIGDYAVKDNKLLIEVAKAKLPQEYNPRAFAAANPQGPAGTTINMISFSGVDETKMGYARNIGVVKSVDDTGRVERITQKKQEQKMLEFYKDKPGAQILEAEVIDGKTTEE